jgi:hypothetical protein
MKKASLFFAVLALAAAGLFAEGFTVGGWGRAVLIPCVLQKDGNFLATIGNSYGNAPEFDISVVGNTPNIGFEYDFRYTGGTIETGNNAFVWGSPVDGLRLALGKIIDWTMMSNATFGDWEFLRLSYTGENFTFCRVNTNGAELSYAQGPLFAYAALDGIFYGAAGGPAAFALGDILKHSYAGAGYKIGDIGTLKAQTLGFANSDDGLYEIVNVAFDLTGVDNLWASAGAYLNTDSVDHLFGNDAGQSTGADSVLGWIRADAVAEYTLGAAKLHALAEYVARKKGGPNLEFGLGADYALDFGVTLLGDVRYLNKAAGAQQLGAGNAVAGGFLGANMAFGSGNVGIGVSYSTSTFATWGKSLVTDDDPNKAHFAVPIRVDYSF